MNKEGVMNIFEIVTLKTAYPLKLSLSIMESNFVRRKHFAPSVMKRHLRSIITSVTAIASDVKNSQTP